MKLAVCLVWILLACAHPLRSQGYAWEGSPREPLTIPRTYVGFEAQASYAMFTTQVSQVDPRLGITCCTYEDGSGLSYELGVVGERWVTSHMKISAGAGISILGATFIAPSAPVPLSNGQILTTEYVLDRSMTYASGFGSVSLRLGSSHVLATVGARLLGYVNGTLMQRERIVSPDDVMFYGPQPTREMVIAQSFESAATPLVVYPFVQISYDLPVAVGIVLQPSLNLALPLMSLSTSDPWHMRSVGLGLRLVKGL